MARVAHSQGVPRLERIAVIGCDECGDSRAFTEIVDVAVSAKGVAWVADASAPKIRAFATDGAALRSFGAQGRGPGELSGISRIFAAGSMIIVIDATAQRLTRFDSIGGFLGSQALGQFPVDVDVDATGDLRLLTTRFAPGSSAISRLSPQATATTPMLGPLAEFPTRDRPREAHALAVATDGRMAITEAGDEYRIRVFARDGTWRDIVRDIPRERYSADELASLERARARGNRLRSAEAARGGVGPGAPPPPPTEKPHLRWAGLRFDPAGRLWVLTGRGSGQQAVIDVYDRDLRLLSEVRLPALVRRFAVGAQHVVTAGEDADGIPAVTIWRLIP